MSKIINIGDLVYIKSKYCSVELLCRVVMAQDYAIKVKLPCVIKGYTHEVVQTKNARLKEPTQDRGEPAARAPYRNPVNNPFRKLVESLTAETAEEEKTRKEAEARAEQKKQQLEKKKLDIRAAAAHIKKNPLGLSDEELDFMQGLSKADQKAYLELLR